MVQIETNEDSSSLSHSQMELGNNNTKEGKEARQCVYVCTFEGIFLFPHVFAWLPKICDWFCIAFYA